VLRGGAAPAVHCRNSVTVRDERASLVQLLMASLVQLLMNVAKNTVTLSDDGKRSMAFCPSGVFESPFLFEIPEWTVDEHHDWSFDG